ncbi:MAG: hypothetical protein RR565_04305 [Erysipelothrix sp.]
MSRILSLTKVLLKTSTDASMQSLSFRKKSKDTSGKKILRIVGFAFLGLYLSFIAFIFIDGLLSQYAPIQQEGAVLFLIYMVLTFYLLMFSVLIIPSIFYFSKDIDSLIVLPLKPWEILISKFLATLVSLYVTISFIVLPLFVSLLIRVHPSFLSMIIYWISVILLPIIPLSIALIVIVILMAFIPFFKNKNIYTYLTMVFSLGIAFIFMSIGNSMSSGADGLDTLMIALQQGNNSLMNSLNTFIPTVKWLSDAFIFIDFKSLIFAILFATVLPCAVLFVIQNLYFNAVVGIDEQSSKKKSLTSSQLKRENKQSKRYVSIMKYDWMTIKRTPTFMMNYLVMYIIMPVMMLFPIITKGGFSEVFAIQDMIIETVSVISPMRLTITVTVVGFLGSIVLGSMSSISSTAISREGQSILSFKSMPFSLMELIHAKILLGSITTLILPTIFGIIAVIYLKLNPLYLILFVLAAILGAFAINTIEISMDVFFPKLDWENEVQAVKQNFVAAIIPLSVIMLTFITIGISFVIDINTVLIIYTGILIIIAAIAYQIIKKSGIKKLNEKIESI